MKSEIDIALKQLVAERNLPPDTVISAFTAGLISAYKKESITPESQNVSVKLDPSQGDVTIIIRKEVVEEVADDDLEIEISAAHTLDQSAAIGDMIVTKSMPYELGRIAAQTARQVMMQRLREAEREFVLAEYSGRENDIFLATILRLEQRHVIVDLGNNTEAVMPKPEQVFTERYRQGQKMKVILKAVENSSKGPELTASRSDSNLVKKLFEMEVPEIFNGAVEIMDITREAGSRSKVAVRAKQSGVDPVGSCVGLRGIRIQNVVNELQGEKIDVIEWDNDPSVFIARALSPAQAQRIILDHPEKVAIAVVSDQHLSLAIGKEGQNARLAARLTGWRVDIKGVEEVDPSLQDRPMEKTEAESAEPETIDEVVDVVVEEVVEEIDETLTESVEVDDAIVADSEITEESSESEPESEPSATEISEEITQIPDEFIASEAEVAQQAIEEEFNDPAVIPEVDSATSLHDVEEDVWSVNRAKAAASQAPADGAIRFAEDIEGLRGGVTVRRGSRGRRDNPKDDPRKKRNTKAGRKRR